MVGVCVGLLVVATAGCLAYLLPTLAGYARRPNRPGAGRHTFAVLIPAHDEETTLPVALRSVAALGYPPDRVRVYVVADNCTDRTAAVARAAGAVCVERADPGRRGKGHALATGFERVRADRPDVVLVLDADCALNPGALRAFDAAFAAGAEAAQAEVRSRNADDGPAGYVAAVGAAVDRAAAVGWDRLGRAVPLRGTGMAFRREVLERVPWAAFGAAEDAQYAAALRAAGVRVRLAAGAVVSADAPKAVADLCRQRRRWRAALRPGRLPHSKPLVLGQLVVTVASCLAAGSFTTRGWAAALVILTAAVYLRGMAEVGLSWRRVGLLLRAPGVVTRLGWLSLAGLVRRPPTTWDRTPRPAAGPVA